MYGDGDDIGIRKSSELVHKTLALTAAGHIDLAGGILCHGDSIVRLNCYAADPNDSITKRAAIYELSNNTEIVPDSVLGFFDNPYRIFYRYRGILADIVISTPSIQKLHTDYVIEEVRIKQYRMSFVAGGLCSELVAGEPVDIDYSSNCSQTYVYTGVTNALGKMASSGNERFLVASATMLNQELYRIIDIVTGLWFIARITNPNHALIQDCGCISPSAWWRLVNWNSIAPKLVGKKWPPSSLNT